MNRRSEYLSFKIFLSMKIVFILAISIDPDEIPHYVAFHLCIQCFPKSPLPVPRMNRVNAILCDTKFYFLSKHYMYFA